MIKNRSVASIFSVLLSVSLCLPAPLLAQTGTVSDVIPEVSQTKAPASGVSVESKVGSILPETNPYRISIPETFGSIEELFQGSADSPLIVYIQNVHSNYEAQLNIKNILAHLVDQYQFSLIQLEGAVSKLDPAILQPSYLKEANLKLVDFLMREGRITGADAFAVETEKPVELHGIEDYSLYMENLKMFKSIYKHQEELKPYFDEVHRLILAVGPKMLNPEQLDFTRKTEEFSTDKIDLLDYVMYMNQISERYKLVSLNEMPTIVDYPNLTRLMRLKNLEEKLNQAGLKKETEALKAEFRKKLPESKQLDEVLLRLDESAKGLNPRAYFLELTDLADQADIDFSIYPAFRIFAEFLIHQDEIDHRVLFSELKKFEEMLQEKLFTTEDEKMFLSLIDHVSLLEQFFRLEVSREKIALYLKDQEQVKPSWIIEQVKGLAEKYAVVSKFSADAVHLDAYRKEVEYFYQLVLKRDEIFSEKIITKTKSLSLDKTIVVTGGFHKDGLIDHFRKEKISYVIINPKVDVKQGNENYLKVMLEDDAIVGSVFAGTFAVENASYANPKSELRLARDVLTPGALITLQGQNYDRQKANERIRSIGSSHFLFQIQTEESLGYARSLRADVRFFNLQGIPLAYEAAGEVDQKGNFLVRLTEAPAPNPQDLTKSGLIRPELPAPFSFSAAALPTLGAVIPKSTTTPSIVTPLQAVQRSLPLNSLIVPIADINRSLTLELMKLNPNAIAEFLGLLTNQTPVSEIPRLIAQANALTRNRGPYKVISMPQDTLTGELRDLFNMLYVGVPQKELLLVHILDIQNEPELSAADLLNLWETLASDQKAVAVVYGVATKQFMMNQFNLNEQSFRTDPVLRRLKFVEREDINSFPEAVQAAQTDILTRPAFLMNTLNQALGIQIGTSEFLSRLAILIPSGPAGKNLSDQIIKTRPEILQVATPDIAGPAKERLSLQEAIRHFQIRIIPALVNDGPARLIRVLGEQAIVNVVGNLWRISGTRRVLELIQQLAAEYRRVAVAA